jgi:hypothetical protein
VSAAAIQSVTIVGIYGLSNAAGQTAVPSPNLWPDARVKEYTKFASGFSLQMAATQNIGTVTAGPELNLGTLLADSGARGPIFLAKVTAGGSRVVDWLPAAASALLPQYILAVQNAISGALAAYPTASLSFINWSILGEQDALNNNIGAVAYAANQQAITASIASQIALPRLDLISLINAQLGTMPVPFLGTTNIRNGQLSIASPTQLIVDNDAITPYNIAASDPHYSSNQCQQVGANAFALL